MRTLYIAWSIDPLSSAKDSPVAARTVPEQALYARGTDDSLILLSAMRLRVLLTDTRRSQIRMKTEL